MPLPSNSASAPERRATTATIDTGTAVASGVVLATTAGTGSLDRCACELAARLDVRAVEIDGYVRTGDLFGVPLLSRRSLQLLVADLDHVRLLRGASGRLVHFPHHGVALLAVYGLGLAAPFLLVGFGFTRALSAVRRIQRRYRAIQASAGVLLVGMGALLLSGYLYLVNVYAQRALRALGLEWWTSL